MPSLPLGKTHGQTTSGVACNHIPWTTHTVEKRRAFYAIVVFGLHTKSDDVRHGMPACPLGSKHCLTTLGKAFHHRPWTTYKVRRRRALHVIIDIGLHLRSKHVERVMLSSSLDFTHGRTTSGMACAHVPWAANTVGQRWARHAIITLGQHTR